MKNYTVAIDDGYAQTKVYGAPIEGGEPVKLVFRTSVRSGRYGLRSMANEGAIDSYRTEEGQEFTVSDLIEAEDTTFNSFHLSPMNRVLVHHGLAKAGYGGHTVNLITGLPVADYFSRDAKDEEKINAKIANLRKGVGRIQSEEPMAVVADVEIGCQAVAAWFDYTFDDAIEFRADHKSRIAVVDIGGRTTDIALVIGGTAIDFSQSGNANLGVLDVYRALEDSIRKEFKIKDRFPLADLDAAVRTRKLTLWGTQEDIAALVAEAVDETASQIKREVERRLGGAASLSAVVFAGGGAELFRSIPESMRNGVLLEDGEFANARGLYKYQQLRARRGMAA